MPIAITGVNAKKTTLTGVVSNINIASLETIAGASFTLSHGQRIHWRSENNESTQCQVWERFGDIKSVLAIVRNLTPGTRVTVTGTLRTGQVVGGQSQGSVLFVETVEVVS